MSEYHRGINLLIANIQLIIILKMTFSKHHHYILWMLDAFDLTSSAFTNIIINNVAY